MRCVRGLLREPWPQKKVIEMAVFNVASFIQPSRGALAKGHYNVSKNQRKNMARARLAHYLIRRSQKS
jgi:hypothetical protein